jgi:hypothetical protein
LADGTTRWSFASGISATLIASGPDKLFLCSM